MIRCNYCGKQNDDSAQVCANCNKPLPNTENVRCEPLPKKTVLEPGGQSAGNVDIDLTQQSQDYGQSTPSNCQKCNYPLQPGATVCPNCGTPVKGSEPAQQPRGNHHPTVLDVVNTAQESQNQGVTFNTPEPQLEKKKPFNGTINIYDNPLGMFDTEFTLTPIKRSNEKHDFQPLNFQGDEVELNREKLEQNNMSITSQTQAVISCEDGKFFIVDKSEYQTTFVRAKDKIEIKDGDVVLMGNRMFEFHTN